MIDVKTWKLSEIRTLWRELTGRPSANQISDADVNKEVNDYYVNHFSSDAEVDEFDVFFTQALSATDSGVYAIDQSVDRLDDPVTINGNQIVLERNREVFFSGIHDHGYHHHFHGSHVTTLHNTHFDKFEDEQFITDPALAIGSDTTKVAHSAFDYLINNFAYSKVASEVDLTGDTVPQNKYGAWSLKIDSDGTITVASADDNVTGYDTPRLALEDLESSDSESAYMGYVTVISTDAGGFVPATTALDDSAVTDTFTDGRFETRTTPTSALLYGQNLYVKPKANDIYELQALQIADRPTAFADDDAVPDDRKWGPVIASMSALLFLERNGEDDVAAKVAIVAKKYMNSIRSDKIKRLLGQVPERNF